MGLGGKTEISANVGDFYLSLSGYVAPYASIVLTSEGVFLRATTADKAGYFYLSEVLVRRGLSSFCLQALDFKRIGESYTCFNIKPMNKSFSMSNIFLPPTLGLSRTEIGEGEEAIASGYSMPGALVTLFVNGEKLTSYADQTGYYQFKLKNLKAGKYELYAKATYEDKESLEPTKKLELRTLSWWEMLLAYLRDIWKKIVNFVTSISLGPLWLGLPLIILIIILIVKLWPERFSFIYQNKVFSLIPFRKKKHLHHSWFIGY